MIPAELLIAGAIFSGMAFAGNLVEEFNALHKDLNNMLSVFVTLSAPTSGGHTVYFDEENKLCKSVQFQHGQFQIGPFERVLHAGEYWTGKRCVISFYLNKIIYEHFEKNGCEKYIQHKDIMYSVTKSFKNWKKYGKKILKELISKVDHFVKNYGCNLETD